MLKRLITVLPVAAALAACAGNMQTSGIMYDPSMAPQGGYGQQAMYQSNFPQAAQNQVQNPAAAPAPRDQFDAKGAINQLASATNTQLSSLDERVRRVERAMIRLDRRMQIIERDEMSRMATSSNDAVLPGAAPAAASAGGFQPTSYTAAFLPPVGGNDYGQLTSPFARGAAAMTRGMSYAPQYQYTAPAQQQGTPGFTQVSASTGAITSPLQAAPDASAVSTPQTQSDILPSLADQGTASSQQATAQVAVWTVQYQQDKIWPDRSALENSKQIIEALRSNKPVAIFARGAHPASKEFRDRVRALSRYLGRVASVDNVPIAAMPANNLDNDTIEVLVAQ